MKLRSAHRIFLGLLIGAIVLFLLKDYIVLPVIMLSIGLLSLLIPTVARAIDTTVSGVLRIIGICLSTILLFIVYFILLTPLALLARLFGRSDNLVLKKPAETNFKSVDRMYDPDSFEKMW